MKNYLFLFTLVVLSSIGFSQKPDPENYFASSRLDYYTNEDVGEIMVYVPDRLKDRKITIDLVFEYQSLNRAYEVSSFGVSTVPFPTELLREGTNEITVSFNEDDKWVDSRKVYLMIRPHRDNAVKIERVNGGIFTNGLVMIPFGFYTNFPVELSLLDEEAVHGFNMISPYQKNDKKSLKSRKAYMDRCADLGMRVNYNICSVAGGGGAVTSKIEGLSAEEKSAMLRKEIEQFRDHPALLTWYIADQPDARNFPADSLISVYQLIKELDPYHPVTILLESPRNAAKYSQVADIIMTAPFPVPQGSILEVKDYTRIPKTEFWLEKPVWIVPQVFGGNEWWKREPNPAEVRAMTYMAIINGASGIQYFIRSAPNSFPKSASTWSECATLATEINELAPDIISPHPAPVLVSDNPGIHAKAWNRAGLVTIAVVNDKPDPAEFKLKMKDWDLTIVADLLFENRKLVIVDGVVTDMIDGLGTRIYRFDSRLTPDKVKMNEKGNMTVDPGFEDLSNTCVPAACYAYNGDDPGSTYFLDSRRHFQGEHSLRLNNPAHQPGSKLSFYGLELDQKKSYTLSIMARTGASSNKPGGKKQEPVRFNLSLGLTGQVFDCQETWQKYSVSGIMPAGQNSETGRVCPQLELVNKGTAWFDMLLVFPDMELKVGLGAEGKSIIEILSIHEGAKIHFTLDGTEPTQSSTLYTVPLEISVNDKLKAAAFKENIRVGYIER